MTVLSPRAFSVVNAKMSQKRLLHAAALIPGGKILVAGGVGGQASSMTAEIFDPKTASWASTPALLHEHWGATLTALPSGRVLPSLFGMSTRRTGGGK